MAAMSVIETAHCTQQIGGLTHGDDFACRACSEGELWRYETVCAVPITGRSMSAIASF